MLKGEALTEAEVEKLCDKLKGRGLKYTVQLEDELTEYRRKYGPLPGKPGEGKIKNNKETAQNEE